MVCKREQQTCNIFQEVELVATRCAEDHHRKVHAFYRHILCSIILYPNLHELLIPYLGNKDKSQDDSGTYEEPSAEKRSIPIDKILQGVGSNNNDCEYNAGDIDCCCNILGIIKALDLHLAS